LEKKRRLDFESLLFTNLIMKGMSVLHAFVSTAYKGMKWAFPPSYAIPSAKFPKRGIDRIFLKNAFISIPSSQSSCKYCIHNE
jgi:hypothetical protein